jgi:cysteinyl-tRNA synthetase
MVRLIRGLLDKGYAYVKDGSVYFSIAKFPEYGKLSKIRTDELQSTERVEDDEYEKENAQDFALWKARKEGEPFWDTAIGPGRPGWHIECSAMSSKYLGETFDIHCGGVDNIFPHHENEIAQSEAYSGHPFVNYWLHCHHLIVNGEKMSKSKGNHFTLRDLRQKQADPLDIRFLLLSTHYRKVLNFTFEALGQAKASVQRIKDFLYELESRSFPAGDSPSITKLIQETQEKFIGGLGDDLNVSVALTALFELIKKANILIMEEKIRAGDADALSAFVYRLDGVLAVLPAKQEASLPEEVVKKIERREEARRAKQYGLADQIRKELLQAGIALEDTKDGVRWKALKKIG